MKNSIKMSTNTQRNDFKTQWQHRQQWQEQAQKSVPDDETILRWVKKTRQASAVSEGNVIPFPTPHRKRWIPYAAVASIAVGVTIIGLIQQKQTNNPLPVAKEVTVGDQTIHFLCNNGCSAQDIILSASEVIK